jgi:hypothetical protein
VLVENHSVYVLNPRDDENYMHTSRCPTGTEGGKSGLPWCIAGSQSDRACFSVATKKAKENMQGMFLVPNRSWKLTSKVSFRLRSLV